MKDGRVLPQGINFHVSTNREKYCPQPEGAIELSRWPADTAVGSVQVGQVPRSLRHEPGPKKPAVTIEIDVRHTPVVLAFDDGIELAVYPHSEVCATPEGVQFDPDAQNLTEGMRKKLRQMVADQMRIEIEPREQPRSG